MRSFVTPNDVYAFYYCCKIKKSRLFSISNNGNLQMRTKQITYMTACLNASNDAPGFPYFLSKCQAVFSYNSSSSSLVWYSNNSATCLSMLFTWKNITEWNMSTPSVRVSLICPAWTQFDLSLWKNTNNS